MPLKSITITTYAPNSFINYPKLPTPPSPKNLLNSFAQPNQTPPKAKEDTPRERRPRIWPSIKLATAFAAQPRRRKSLQLPTPAAALRGPLQDNDGYQRLRKDFQEILSPFCRPPSAHPATAARTSAPGMRRTPQTPLSPLSPRRRPCNSVVAGFFVSAARVCAFTPSPFSPPFVRSLFPRGWFSPAGAGSVRARFRCWGLGFYEVRGSVGWCGRGCEIWLRVICFVRLDGVLGYCVVG